MAEVFTVTIKDKIFLDSTIESFYIEAIVSFN